MKLLLDTHAFLWIDAESRKVSPRVVEAIDDPANEVYLSSASVWELQIKIATGKLSLGRPLLEVIRDQQETGLQHLPVEVRHVFTLDSLPDHHRDPFDRILIATALCDDMTLVTCDASITRYPVPTLW